MDRHVKQINHETSELDESFASLTLSDGEENSRRYMYLEEVTIHEGDIGTVQEDTGVSDVYSSK